MPIEKRGNTVSIDYIRSLLEILTRNGIDLHRYFIELNLETEILTNPDACLSDVDLVRLWEESSKRLDDDLLGLHVGEQATIGRWGLVDHLAMNSKTLREMIQNTIDFRRVVVNVDKTINLRREADLAIVSFYTKSIDLRHYYEAETVYASRLARFVLATDIGLREIRFKHQLPRATSEYERIFGVPVRFGQKENALVFANDDLDRPTAHTNPILQEILREQAEKMLSIIDNETLLSEKVKEILITDLLGFTIDRVAEQLMLSVRTMQRKLNEEGLTYRQIVDSVRKERARKYLEEKLLTLGEISYFLGFSEASSFNQAAKRWFGKTPGLYREYCYK